MILIHGNLVALLKLVVELKKCVPLHSEKTFFACKTSHMKLLGLVLVPPLAWFSVVYEGACPFVIQGDLAHDGLGIIHSF